MKTCTSCKLDKQYSEFHKDCSKPDGFRPKCKKCRSIQAVKYYIDNKDVINKSGMIWKNNNRNRMRQTCKEYYNNHKSDYTAYTSKRRAAKLNATVKWITDNDLLFIKGLYNAANRVSKCLGVMFHVDHIIPLSGKLVSGLHVPLNLTIIPAGVNLSKGNKYDLEVYHP